MYRIFTVSHSCDVLASFQDTFMSIEASLKQYAAQIKDRGKRIQGSEEAEGRKESDLEKGQYIMTDVPSHMCSIKAIMFLKAFCVYDRMIKMF